MKEDKLKTKIPLSKETYEALLQLENAYLDPLKSIVNNIFSQSPQDNSIDEISSIREIARNIAVYGYPRARHAASYFVYIFPTIGKTGQWEVEWGKQFNIVYPISGVLACDIQIDEMLCDEKGILIDQKVRQFIAIYKILLDDDHFQFKKESKLLEASECSPQILEAPQILNIIKEGELKRVMLKLNHDNIFERVQVICKITHLPLPELLLDSFFYIGI